MDISRTYAVFAAAEPGSIPSRLGATMLFLLLLVGCLGLLAVMTLVRWSLRRAGRIEQSPPRQPLPESAWKTAGKRAKPIDDQPDESEGG